MSFIKQYWIISLLTFANGQSLYCQCYNGKITLTTRDVPTGGSSYWAGVFMKPSPNWIYCRVMPSSGFYLTQSSESFEVTPDINISEQTVYCNMFQSDPPGGYCSGQIVSTSSVYCPSTYTPQPPQWSTGVVVSGGTGTYGTSGYPNPRSYSSQSNTTMWLILLTVLAVVLCAVFTVVCVVMMKKRQQSSFSTRTDLSGVNMVQTQAVPSQGYPSAPTQTNIPVVLTAPPGIMMPPTVYSNNPAMATSGLYVQPPVLMPVYMGTNQ